MNGEIPAMVTTCSPVDTVQVRGPGAACGSIFSTATAVFALTTVTGCAAVKFTAVCASAGVLASAVRFDAVLP